MVNTTVKPLARLRCAISAASFTGSVVTGIATSWMLTSSAERDTLVSEQTANARRSSWVCAVHSRRVCESREIDGTANRMRALPPFSNAARSAIFRAVKVLPVPQAMINLPRSLPFSKPAKTSSIAAC